MDFLVDDEGDGAGGDNPREVRQETLVETLDPFVPAKEALLCLEDPVAFSDCGRENSRTIRPKRVFILKYIVYMLRFTTYTDRHAK